MRECIDCGFYTSRPPEEMRCCPICHEPMERQEVVKMKRENQATIDLVNEIKRLSDANVELQAKLDQSEGLRVHAMDRATTLQKLYDDTTQTYESNQEEAFAALQERYAGAESERKSAVQGYDRIQGKYIAGRKREEEMEREIESLKRSLESYREALSRENIDGNRLAERVGDLERAKDTLQVRGTKMREALRQCDVRMMGMQDKLLKQVRHIKELEQELKSAAEDFDTMEADKDSDIRYLEGRISELEDELVEGRGWED